MKSIQYTYPYPSGTFTFTGNIKQIGIEVPHGAPLYEHNYSADIVIADNNYTISLGETLEFGYLNFSSVTMNIRRVSSPYVIIDIGYE